jgi:hypothetical protein
MPTVHERIAATDRRIERMKVLVQQQLARVENLERDQYLYGTQRARVLLNRMLAELSSLQRFRLSLYQQATFGDVPKKKAS